MNNSDLIKAWLDSGNAPTRVETAAMDIALQYTPYTAYGRTMKISSRGRLAHRTSVKIAGTKIEN